MKPLSTTLILYALISQLSFAQIQGTVDISQHCDCSTALRIDINQIIGPTTAPSGYGNELEFEGNTMGDPYYFEKEHNTTWYKFKIPENGILSFDIIPQDLNDDYDFLLYKGEIDEFFFCNYGVPNKISKPIRTNLSRNKKENRSMTGLENTSKDLFVASGIGKSYSQSINVKKGETYFLVTDNVYDNGSGHSLCFYYDSSLKVQGSVSDSKTKAPIKAEIKIETSKSGNTLAFSISDKINGTYELNSNKDSIVDSAYYTVSAFADKYFFKEKILSGSEIKKGLESDFNFFLDPIQKGENFAIRSINFYSGTAQLLPSAEPSLKRLLRFLIINPSIKIILEGHTNGVGTKSSLENHMTLSKMRAETVFEFLTSNGISKDRISCIGLGYSKMIYPNARTLRKRRANMRVELTIIEYQELE